MRPVHVNPHHVKKSKELDDNNPGKNDRKDPKTIAGLVNEGRFSYPYLPTGVYAEIRNLSNMRFQAQENITRVKTGSPDGCPSIFRSIMMFTGTPGRSAEEWCCAQLHCRKISENWEWKA